MLTISSANSRSGARMARKPDRKIGAGAISGGIVGIISVIFTALFHRSLTPEEIAIIPAALAWIGHFLGGYLTPYKGKHCKNGDTK